MKSQRMNSTPEERSLLSKLNAESQLKNGTHVSQIPGGMDNARLATQKKIEDGTHLFLNSEFHRYHNSTRITNGTHHFLNPEFRKHIDFINQLRVTEGTHHFCDKNGNRINLKRQ